MLMVVLFEILIAVAKANNNIKLTSSFPKKKPGMVLNI